MSNTPGISPLTPDLEEIRHSDDDEFDHVENTETDADGEETEKVRIERIKRKTIDLA